MPGYADCVRDRGREAIEPHVDRGRPDATGNLVGTVEGEANYDVVAAHMDEIGVVVRHVDDDGSSSWTRWAAGTRGSSGRSA